MHSSQFRYALAVGALLSLAACDREPQSTQEQSGTTSAAAPKPADKALSCDWPVTKGETAESLLAKYGDDAVVGPLAMDNATSRDGVILFRAEIDQRIEITFHDKEMTKVASVRLGEDATAWKGPKGLHLGSPLADVTSANGAFALDRFSWEDGGYNADVDDGRLGQLPGGCALSLRLKPTEEGHKSMGNLLEEDEVPSSDERVAPLGATVVHMAVTWPKSAYKSN